MLPERRTAARTGLAALQLAPILVSVVWQASWVGLLLHSSDPLGRLRHLDWYAFFQAGHRLLAGDLQALYPRELREEFLWLYPPYCAYVTAPLGLLSEQWAYIVCCAVQVASVAGALTFLRATLSAERYVLDVSAVIASSFFNSAVIIGQASGFWALILAASLWSWHGRRDFVTGLLLALMLAKPNWGVVFPAMCLLTRQWRVLGGIAVGFGVMLLSSLPLGLERWHDFARTTHAYVDFVEQLTPMSKQLTMYAFWRTLPGLPHSHGGAITALWLASVLPLLAVTVAAWRRRWSEPTPPLPRLFGLTVLLTIAGNLYVYSYDGLLLLLPAIVWHVQGDQYRSRTCRRLIGGCVLLVFVFGYVALTYGGVAWIGPLVALWLLGEAYDLLSAAPPVTTSRPAGSALGFQTWRVRQGALERRLGLAISARLWSRGTAG